MKRAIKMRVRFLGDDAKTVRRSFNSHGGAVRYIWNSAVRWIASLPVEERRRAYNKDLLSKRFCTTKQNALKDLDATDELYEKKLGARDKKRQRLQDEGLVIGAFVSKTPWLNDINAQTRQQAMNDLVKAYEAGVAKQKAQRGRGERVVPFAIKQKHKSKPSAWTFVIPGQSIKAEHVRRPTASVGEGENHVWTKLTLPKTLGDGKKQPVVFLTGRADLKDGTRLLADARFTRDRLGKWSCVVHRTPFAPKPLRPIDQRVSAFLDPGSRTGQTAYCPDQARTTSYLEGKGGVAELMDIRLQGGRDHQGAAGAAAALPRPAAPVLERLQPPEVREKREGEEPGPGRPPARGERPDRAVRHDRAPHLRNAAHGS